MNITISPEALEAGARAMQVWLSWNVESDTRAHQLTDEERAAAALAAFTAMVEAWPGMQTGSDDGGMTLSAIYLPLTETPDE